MSLKNIDTIIFDLNGTLYERGIAIENVNNTLQTLKEKGYNLTFITNTDGRSIADVYNSVIKKGIEIRKEELYTPVTAVKEFINENRNKTFYPLVHDDVLVDLEGTSRDEHHPDYVIIGDFCDKVSHEEINKVFRMIKNGAEIIALSKTLWYIDVDGYTINTGAFVKMFEIACNKEAILMGKPSEKFFHMGLKRTNSSPERTVVVGDDITTDILGAKQINTTGILVKTGVYSEVQLEKAQSKPDYIIENVNELIKLLNI